MNYRVVPDLPFPRYLWTVAKNTTRTERLACTSAILLLVAVGAVIAVVVVRAHRDDQQDFSPHEWNITRAMWLAREYANPLLNERYEPVRLVVVHHSSSTECHSFSQCAAELRNLQAYYIRDKDSDIPYNFIIGNDGRVYEGQGWDIQGAYLKGYNLCSLGIGFIGDYREECEVHSTVTELQLNRTLKLLEWGVLRGSLHPRYLVSGAKDLRPSESPGSSLHNAIKQWPHYDHLHLFSNRTCDDIIATPL